MEHVPGIIEYHHLVLVTLPQWLFVGSIPPHWILPHKITDFKAKALIRGFPPQWIDNSPASRKSSPDFTNIARDKTNSIETLQNLKNLKAFISNYEE
jgi:hypothetical protein